MNERAKSSVNYIYNFFTAWRRQRRRRWWSIHLSTTNQPNNRRTTNIFYEWKIKLLKLNAAAVDNDIAANVCMSVGLCALAKQKQGRKTRVIITISGWGSVGSVGRSDSRTKVCVNTKTKTHPSIIMLLAGDFYPCVIR